MSGIFPRPGDGTLPPNPNDTNNPIRAYDPMNRPLDTAALYYGNGCDVRLRPEVMNSLISEMASLTDIAELNYNPAIQTNIQLATRYLIQRGLPKYTEVIRNADQNDAPSNYWAYLDPPATRYNDGMVLCLAPSHNNMHEVRLDVNGLGVRPVLRNDGQELRRRDWSEHIPFLIGYWGDAWYHLSIVRSQVPLVGYGDLDVWVRTDGSDETGDGEFNTPESAFRTIQHAWDDVAGRYAPTPTFRINIRLGIPGTYEGADMSTYGGYLAIWGDVAFPEQYRIKLKLLGGIGYGSCLGFSAMNFVWVHGISCVIDRNFPPTAGFGIVLTNSTTCVVDSCYFESEAQNAPGTYMVARSRCTLYTMGPIRCRGANNDIGGVLAITEASNYMNAEAGLETTLYCDDLNLGHGIWCYGGSVVDLSHHLILNSNNFGPRFGVGGMSIIMAKGQPLPGNTDGTIFDGGLYYP